LAFLCGGRRHLLRVALLSLIDRELLQAREFFRGLNSRGKSLRLHAPTHELELAVSLKILAAFQGFCARHRVVGHISLSGGDPLWYPGTRTL
jgi:hypothetical protein